MKQLTIKKAKEHVIKNKQIPIYRGCSNTTCLCTGECRVIIGYRERVPGEHVPTEWPINRQYSEEYFSRFMPNCIPSDWPNEERRDDE